MQRKNAVKNSRFRGYFFERATRTTFGISSSFERLQILFAAFARKKLDVQPHGAIPLRCGKNLVNKGVHKLLSDLAVGTIPLGISKHLADTFHIAAEFLAGLLLLPKLGKLLLGGFDIGVAL